MTKEIQKIIDEQKAQNSELIDKYKFFKHSLKEGEGGSFALMSGYLIHLFNLLKKEEIHEEYWEKKVMTVFDTVGEEINVSVENIVCTHDIRLHKMLTLANEAIQRLPVGLLLTNGWFLLFDGHHRCVAQMANGATTINVRSIEAPKILSKEIIKKVEEEEKELCR